jgi:HTH-type transcriptional regulator / antitoxin HigA
MTNSDAKTPGDLIREKLANRGLSQLDLAKILGRPAAAINELVCGKRGITLDTAIQLALVFENDPREWLTADADYRLSQANTDDPVIRKRTRLFALAPIKDMERRGWITETKTAEQLEAELCRFFGTDSLENEPTMSVSRRSSLGGPITAAQRAWCFRAHNLATSLGITAEYSENRLERVIPKLRRLAAWPDNAAKVSEVLASAGIRFVVVEHLPKTRIDGAAFWLDAKSPAVAVSIRFDRNDSFWHTLGHELSHIRHRDAEALDIDLVGTDRPSPLEYDATERRADEESAATWLDQSELKSFIVRVGPLYSRARINQFANKLKVHPAIIIGQLQHLGELGYQACHDCIANIRSIVVAEALTDGWGHTVKV